MIPNKCGSRRFRVTLVIGAIWLGCCRAEGAGESLDYRVELSAATSGYDAKTCWMQARAGAVPAGAPGNADDDPLVIITMQKLELSRSDVYYGLQTLESSDLGKTWRGPTEQSTLARRSPRPGVEVAPCDFTPLWHRKTQKLLGTGATFWYDAERNDHLADPTSETCYAVYDPVARGWSEWRTLKLPDDARFTFSRAGCTQRYDLPDGDVLLPIYFSKSRRNEHASSAVFRCRFDGQTLTYVEHGNEMTVPEKRGLGEPSLTRFGQRFYLTLRNDVKGYVATSSDGLHFENLRPWTFDDGSELGSYNTQQHWVTHSDGLFLVYTRRGANNDNVFRNRAPLFIARVDPEKLVVLRATEQALIPNRGAALGNFGVVDVTTHETWVIASEGMQPAKAATYGSDNSVWVARLVWSRPNRLLDATSP